MERLSQTPRVKFAHLKPAPERLLELARIDPEGVPAESLTIWTVKSSVAPTSLTFNATRVNVSGLAKEKDWASCIVESV